MERGSERERKRREGRQSDLPLVTSWMEENEGGWWLRGGVGRREDEEGGSVVMAMRSSLC